MDDENKMDPVASSIEPVETKQEVPEQPKSVQDQAPLSGRACRTR